MNPAPFRAVVDASVAVKLFVPETLSNEAQALFARFAEDNDAALIVPDLFFAECANVFWKWVQRFAYPAGAAREHLSDLAGLGLTALPTQVLADEALRIALKHRVSAYDACYIAAASQLQLPLVTADERLARQMDKGPYNVQWLGDAKLPPR